MRNRVCLTLLLLVLLAITLAAVMGAGAAPARAGAVGGQVTDAVSGRPIPGAYVYWYTAAGDYYGYSYADTNGEWMIAVGEGLWKFRFASAYHPDQWWSGKPDKDSADLYLVTGAPQLDMNVALARTPQAHVKGTLTDATSGDPIQGVTVTACVTGTDLEPYNGQYTQTAADGTYDLTVLPGSYDLVFTHYAHRTVYYRHATTKDAATALTLADGDLVTGTDEAMPRIPVVVTGQALDMDLNWVPGVELQLVDPVDGHVLRSATTDAEGHCTIDVSDMVGRPFKERFHDPAGVYADLYNNYFVYGTTSFADAATITPVLGMPYYCSLDLFAVNTGEIKGRTLDAQGRPVPNVPVWVSGGSNYSVESQSDANGVYDITGLHVSGRGTKFAITFNPNDLWSEYLTESYPAAPVSSDRTRVLVLPGGSVTADSCLYKKSAITGTVSDPGGVLRGIRVTLYRDDGTQVGQDLTWADGVYQFPNLWPGTYTLGFQDTSGSDTGVLPGDHDAYYGGAANVMSATRITFDGTTLKTVTADQGLEPWGGIRVDAQCDVEPYLGIDGLDVTLYNADKQAIAPSSTREGNAYLFKSLPLGTYYVTANDARGVYKSQAYDNAASLDAATPILLTRAASKARPVMRMQPVRGVSPDTGALPDGSTTTAALHLGIRPQSIAADGDTALICGQGSGSQDGCFVYQHGDAGWARKQLLDLPVADIRSVAVDGDVAAVCSLNSSGHDGLQGAMLWIYRRTGGVWQLEQSLRPEASVSAWGFGRSVAVSGETILVGAPWATGLPFHNAGAVFVYVHGAGGWTQEARITSADRHDTFGERVALDGDRALVGAGGLTYGSVDVYERSTGAWQKTGELTRPQAVIDEAAEYGAAIALDGERAVVGAPGHDRSAGAVYVFDHGAGGWSLSATLGAADGQPDDRFGQAVDLSGGDVLAGAPTRGTARFRVPDGAAYLFRLSDSTWRQDAEMQSVPGITAAYFGTTVAVAGRDLFVGSPGETRADGSAGRVHVFSPYVTDAGVPLVADAGRGVLANDVGPAGSALTATLVTAPAHGQVQLGVDGSFVYTPDAAFVGIDQFTYRDVSGDWQSDPAAVDITVRGTAAPTLTVEGAPTGWVNTAATVELAASAQGGIAAIEYRGPDAGLWTSYGAPIMVTAQGESTYQARSRDVFGNASSRQFSVKLDTARPVPAASRSASARRGRTCSLGFTISDQRPGSPTADVRVVVKDARGRQKWSGRLFARPVNTALTCKFRCTLPAGKYRFYVYATDAAGNTQAAAAGNRLTVRR